MHFITEVQLSFTLQLASLTDCYKNQFDTNISNPYEGGLMDTHKS